MLAGLVRAPSHDAPCVSAERATAAAKSRASTACTQQGRISEAQLAEARSARRCRAGSHDRGRAACARRRPRRRVLPGRDPAPAGRACSASERVLRGGLRVYSTYDPVLQRPPSRPSARVSPRSRRRGAAPATCRAASWPSIPRPAMCSRSSAAATSGELLQPRDAGPPSGRVRVQADHLRRGARARIRPGTVLHDLDTPIYASGRAGCPAASTRIASTRCAGH